MHEAMVIGRPFLESWRSLFYRPHHAYAALSLMIVGGIIYIDHVLA
jgi:hypothetical protein